MESINEVRQCPNCGKAQHLCTCEEEELEEDEEEWSEETGAFYADDVDAFGRNYSDADPGL